MIARLLAFVEARTGIPGDLRRAMEAELPGAPRGIESIWAVILALLVFQAATGLALALFYAPTSTDAWGSVYWITHVLPAGGPIRSAHRVTMSVLVGVIALHLAAMAISGRYRPPREIAWWSSLALLLLVLGFAITGNPLPWDQRGFWASRVEAEIMGAAPVLGGLVRRVFQGGSEYGNTTLTRLYALHALVLPGTVIAVVVLRARAARRIPEQGRPATRLDQLALDLPVAALAIAAVAVAALRLPAPLSAPADLSARWLARPEWYFLPLNQLLTLVPGPLGSMVVPALGLAVLAALPFLDRPGRRLPALAPLGASALAVAGLLALGLVRGAVSPEVAAARADAARKADRALLLARAGIPADGAAMMIQRDPLSLGERVFEVRCRGCHLVGGQGTDEPNGPDLAGYLSAPWLRAVTEHPEDPRFFGTTEITGMEDYAGKDPALLDAVVALMRGLRAHPGAAAEDLPPQLAPGLEAWAELTCDSCHELDPQVEGAAPNLNGYGSDAWLSAFLKDPGAELHYSDQNEMPAFATRLNDAEIAGVITYLRTLEALPVASPREIGLATDR